MSERPRVVFGMPAHNRADALGRTLESLLSQTYPDLAIVIVDDRPTAEVTRVVDTYAALDPRVEPLEVPPHPGAPPRPGVIAGGPRPPPAAPPAPGPAGPRGHCHRRVARPA